MANWLKANSTITTLGNKLLSYVVAGLATLDFTRVVVRDTVSTVSTNKEYTLSDIPNSSIKQTGRLLHFQGGIENPSTHDFDTSLVTARFSNEELGANTTFYIRQIVLFARLKDIDTAAMSAYDPSFVDPGEVPYLVAQSEGQSDYDLMPKQSENPTSFDYNLYIVHTGTANISVSINTTGFVSTATFNLTVQEIRAEIQDAISSQVGKSAGERTCAIWVPSYNPDTPGISSWSRSDSSFPPQTCYPSSEYFNAYGTHHIVYGGTEYYDQIVTGAFSHAEGNQNVVTSRCSHVEGEHNYCGTNPDSSSISDDDAEYSYVGGNENTAVGGKCQLVHGLSNYSDGSYSIVTGSRNTNRSSSSVVSGQDNSFQSQHSLLSGSSNTTVGGRQIVVSGVRNSVSIGYEDSGGHTYNTTSSIISGDSNTCNSTSNSLLIGENNYSTACPQSIISGQNNTVFEGSDLIISGYKNSDAGSSRCIISGSSNQTYESVNTLVVGGSTQAGDNHSNVVTSANESLIFGDMNQVVSSSDSITGGYQNSVVQINQCAIIGRQCAVNTCTQSLVTGISNTVNYANRSNVSGSTNTVYHTTDSIVAGYSNTTDNVQQSAVFGVRNTANMSVVRSVISGEDNLVTKEVLNSTSCSVVSGTQNRVTDSQDSLVSGFNHNAQYVINSIVSGSQNSVVCASYEGSKSRSRGIQSSIVTGIGNTVAQTESSIIFGATNNVKDYQPHGIPSEFAQTRSVLIGGDSNTITGANRTAVFGSLNNVSNLHDSLVSGYDNIVNGLDSPVTLPHCVLVSGRDNAVQNYGRPQTVFGTGNNVTGQNSLTSGSDLISASNNSLTLGRFNVADTSNAYAVVVGAGLTEDSRANIFTIDWSGIVRANDLYIGDSASSVNSRIAELENQLEGLEAILIELRGASQNSGD